MHYYKRNLGDYAKKAGRLSMLQHGAYTLLIDSCYDREQFPTRDEAIEWTWASSQAEIEAVDFVLRKFFTLENGVFVQKRIQEELLDYQIKSDTNKRIAKDRETKRADNATNRERLVDESSPAEHEPPPNHKPLTSNQEPTTTTTTLALCASPKRESVEVLPDGFAEFYAAYPRKKSKHTAIRAWLKIKPNEQTRTAIMAGLSRAMTSADWTRDGGQFVPYPATWLNAGGWQDDTSVVSLRPKNRLAV